MAVRTMFLLSKRRLKIRAKKMFVVLNLDMHSSHAVGDITNLLLQDQEYPYLFYVCSIFVIKWDGFHLCCRLLLIHVCSLRMIWETYAIKLALNRRLWIP